MQKAISTPALIGIIALAAVIVGFIGYRALRPAPAVNSRDELVKHMSQPYTRMRMAATGGQSR